MFTSVVSDVRTAARSAVRQPGFTAVVVITLALGIGTTTAMFAIVHAALLKPLPYADPDRLVLARRTVGGDLRMWNSAPDYYDYREQTDAFQSFARVAADARKVTLTDGERPERVSATRVSDDLFTTLGVAPVAGRTFHPDEGRAGAPYVVMVSERLARRRFGTVESAVGRTLSLSGLSAPWGVAATIVGVVPDSFRLLDAVDAWGVIRRGENDGPATRRFHNWIIVARLKPGVSLETAQRQVDVVSGGLQQLYPETNKTKALQLDPLQSAIFQRQRPRLLMLMAAVALVLLIACANVAGLLLARGVARRSEFALRIALGASRARLMGALLVESLSLSVLAGIAGIGLAAALQRVLPVATGLASSGVSASGQDWPVVLFALAVSIATGLAAGIAPALRISRRGPASDLAPGGRATDSKGGVRMQSLLVVMQVGVSLLLLVGAGLLIRSFTRLSSVELGLDAHHVLTGEIQLPFPDAERRVQFFTGLRDDIATLPGVSAVSFTSHVPVRDPAGDPPIWAEGRPPVDSSQTLSAALRIVLPGYFDTLRIPILVGRDLAETDRNATRSVLVINQAMARRLFPGESPLGKRVVMPRGGDGPIALEIVGVVGDARIYGVGVGAPMTMYASVSQIPINTLNLVVRTAMDPDVLIGAVREAVAARNRDVALENLVGLEEIIGDSLAPEQVMTITIVMFSAVALLLASLGLYGVLAYQVTQRRHEIGVRMALGATPHTVVLNVMARTGLLVAPGLALGLAAVIAGTRLIAGQLYDIAPHDPIAIGVATATLAVVACAASALPAWRAARVNPVQALRGE